jgi:hypothetical protein
MVAKTTHPRRVGSLVSLPLNKATARRSQLVERPEFEASKGGSESRMVDRSDGSAPGRFKCLRACPCVNCFVFADLGYVVVASKSVSLVDRISGFQD